MYNSTAVHMRTLNIAFVLTHNEPFKQSCEHFHGKNHKHAYIFCIKYRLHFNKINLIMVLNNEVM
jgi:hypothetical protein